MDLNNNPKFFDNGTSRVIDGLRTTVWHGINAISYLGIALSSSILLRGFP